MFMALEKLGKSYYRIFETGTTRVAGNWEGDGQSTVLFDKFVNFYDGVVFSVDIDPRAIANARGLVSYKTQCVCGDSVRFLKSMADMTNSRCAADLVYLDSYDLDVDDPLPSMFHHIKELLALGSLASGTLVVVDDNLVYNGKDTGKGKFVEEYFNNIGVKIIYRGYQMIWQVS